MRADELTVGQSYAYVKYHTAQPRRAELLTKPDSGYVSVRIFHPDLGGEEQRIKTSDLANGWDEVPDSRFTVGSRFGNRTWHDIADAAYAHVQRSRALADRLGALGIYRVHQHYAGRGGTDGAVDANVRLVLSYDELERLIGIAEQARGPRLDPTAVYPVVDDGADEDVVAEAST